MPKTYFGKETAAALKNFPFSGSRSPREFIAAMAEVKEAAARAHLAGRSLDRARAGAIIRAAHEVRSGKFDDQFPISALQGGAGTSLHMNMNEVVAARAAELLAKGKRKIDVHPIDHVNRGQSTNDVNPSALKIASIRLARRVLRSTDQTIAALNRKAREFRTVRKLGRTHLQDAVPTTLGDEFAAYAALFERNRRRLADVFPYLYELNLGGTAIGTSVNAPPAFRRALYRHLVRITKLPLVPARNLASQTSSGTDFYMLSSALVALTLDASKMASDLRLLASGPSGGLGEIRLKPLQKGSSIMPGKVNPVLLEAVNQLHCIVAGNDLAIREAAHLAQLELGTMGPVIADRLLQSLTATAEVLDRLAVVCLPGIRANRERCRELLERSTAYATLLVPRLGYDAVARLVQGVQEDGKTLRELTVQRGLLSAREFDRLVKG
jgi:aspartate ammonia-lyase